MKLTKILTALLLVSALPAAASQPVFGAQVELNHVANHDDRCDIQMNNLTGQSIVWGSADPYNGQVNAWAVTSNGFAPNGWQSTLTTSPASWMTTLSWLHTAEDNPFWAQNYNIWCGTGPGCPSTYGNSGYYNFWLMAYPYSKNDILTDLKLAFAILESIGNLVEIALGDEEAWEELSKNVTEACEEGNEIANEPNNGWCGIVYADNNLSTPVGQLAYPIIGGTDKKRDHVAFNINGVYVAQVMAVNQASSLTGNPQYVVNFYTMAQWNFAYNGIPIPPPPPGPFSVSPMVLSLAGNPFPPPQTLTVYNPKGAVSLTGSSAVFVLSSTCTGAMAQCTMSVQVVPGFPDKSVIVTDGVSSVTVALQ